MKRAMRGKRGQVYLLAALILGFILFILVAETNLIRKTIIDDDFESLAKNYGQESAAFMNLLLEKGAANIAQEFLKFTILFSSYAKTKNPEFGIIYAFIYQDRLYIGNYLATEMMIQGVPPAKERLPGCYQQLNASVVIENFPVRANVPTAAFTACMTDISIPAANTLRFSIQDVVYEVELESSRPDIIIVGREEVGSQRKVYSKGNFKKGTDI